MRFFGLIPAALAFNSILSASAVPIRASKAMPVPVVGDVTLGLIGPTTIPNIVTPNLPAGAPSVPGAPAVPGAPTKRALHGNPTLRPRGVRSADYGVAANATGPIPTSTSQPATVEKRATKSHAGHATEKGKGKGKGTHPHAQDTSSPSGVSGNGADPSSSAQSAASGVKAVGATPKEDVSPAFYSLPLGDIPDTPLTAPDAGLAADQAAGAAPAPAPQPKPQPESKPAPADPNAYAGYSGYPSTGNGASDFTSPASPPAQKRHDLVLDTDPLIPPNDGTKTDPRMGAVNIDSNRKAEPHDLPKPSVPSSGTVPDAPQGGSLDPAYPDVYNPAPAAPDAPAPVEPAPAPVA